MLLEWMVARRYLASHQGGRFLSLITLISTGGVFVGVAALIAVTAVMTGLQEELRRKIIAVHPHVSLVSADGDQVLQDWRRLVARVRRVEGVEAAAPYVFTEVGLSSAGGWAEAAALRGVEPAPTGEPITDISAFLQRGELSLGPTRSGLPPLVTGTSLAHRFGLVRGDVVTLTALQGIRVSPMGTLVAPMRRFEFVGHLRLGVHQYDNSYMYTSLEAAQELIGLGSAVTGLEIRVRDPMEAPAVRRGIEEDLGAGPYRTQDWQSMNAALFSALKLEKLAMALILGLIVLVAALNIVSTLTMVVTNKTRGIGILMTMGLRAPQVQRVFLLQGLVIGTAGAVLGGAAGLLLVWVVDRYQLVRIPVDVYFVDRLPMVVDPGDVSLILGASVLISFIATIYPARLAARLYPVEAIRHE